MKTKKLAFSFLITVIIFLTGCGAASILDHANEEELKQVETSRIFQSDYASTWAAVMKMAALNQVIILNQDKDSGLITTDWILEKGAVGVFQAGERYRGNFFVEKNGSSQTKVTITPQFQKRHGADSAWLNVIRPKRHLILETSVFNMIQDNLG